METDPADVQPRTVGPRFVEYRRVNHFRPMHPKFTAPDRMIVSSMIDEARSGKHYPQRSPGRVNVIVVHRLGPELGVLPEQIIKSFGDTSKYAAGSYTKDRSGKGRVPYQLYIDPWGRCTQFLEISDVGPHAARWNYVGIGVAVSGDFRVHPPTWLQANALGKICSYLAHWIGDGYRVAGHTELPGGTNDPDKKCPGAMLSLADLRTGVARHLELLQKQNWAPESGAALLSAVGIVI